jgi:hypothetical protein
MFRGRSPPGEQYISSKDIGKRRYLYGGQPDEVRRLQTLLEKHKANGRKALRLP